MTLREMSEFFSTSDEFTARYGTLTDTEFVRQTYLHVMEREPDQGGYDFWIGKLEEGMSRGELTVFFSDSPEFRTLTHTN